MSGGRITGKGCDVSSLERRFNALHMPEPNSGCWIWLGADNGKGYGQVAISRSRPVSAHRASWIVNRGAPLSGLLVLHHCDNRSCVNPDHLYLGTYSDNRRDMLLRGKWKHPYSKRLTCSKGHHYSDYGFTTSKDGARVCRECSRRNQASFRIREKQATHHTQKETS